MRGASWGDEADDPASEIADARPRKTWRSPGTGRQWLVTLTDDWRLILSAPGTPDVAWWAHVFNPECRVTPSGRYGACAMGPAAGWMRGVVLEARAMVERAAAVVDED